MSLAIGNRCLCSLSSVCSLHTHLCVSEAGKEEALSLCLLSEWMGEWTLAHRGLSTRSEFSLRFCNLYIVPQC